MWSTLIIILFSTFSAVAIENSENRLNSLINISAIDENIQRIIFNETRWGMYSSYTGAILNVTAIEITNVTGIFYEIRYALEVHHKDYGLNSTSTPLGVQFTWLVNNTINTYVRYVNISIPNGTRVFFEEFLVYNLSNQIDYAEVKIQHIDCSIWESISYGEHAKLPSRFGKVPILTTHPNHFEFGINIETSDGENKTYHQLRTEVFWPNISDYFAFGKIITTTIREAPINCSALYYMKMMFYVSLWTRVNDHSSTGYSTFQRKFCPPDENQISEFVWHSVIEDMSGDMDYYLPYYDEYNNQERWFFHTYLINIEDFKDFNGFEIDVQFGQTFSSDRSISGFLGISLSLSIAIISLLLWVTTRVKHQNTSTSTIEDYPEVDYS